MNNENYLKKELYELISSNNTIVEFLQRGSLDGLWYWDVEDGNNEWMSKEFWRLFGYNPKEKKHLASEWKGMIFEEDLKVALDNFTKHCEDPNHTYDQVVRYRHKDGSTVWVRCRGIAIRDENGKPVRMLGAHNDLTAQIQAQQELEKSNKELKESQQEILALNKELARIARRDPLTGLYNRYFLDELLLQEKERADRSRNIFSVVLLDLNDFKGINDTYGHLAGDKVLKTFAKGVKSMLRKQDIVSRWGGDEFLLVLPENNYDESVIVVNKIHDKMPEWSFDWEGKTISFTVSAGIAEYQLNESCNACVNRADRALYNWKKKKNNRVSEDQL